MYIYPWTGNTKSCEYHTPILDDLITTNWVEQSRYKTTPQRYFTLSHAFYATMGGFAFYINNHGATSSVEESLFELSSNPDYVVHVPTWKTCMYLVEHFPDIFTDTPEEFIFERAKASSLSKALLIVQVGWFCTNCASRLLQRLPLSLLEVTTAAHAFCTLLTYFVWWSKPLNVMTPTIIKGKKAREMNALLTCNFVEYSRALEMAKKMAGGDSSMRTEGNKKDEIVLAANILQHHLTAKRLSHFPVYNDDDPLYPGSHENSWGHEWITVAISPILYGLVHFLAWSDNFPTLLEGLLWRASSLVVTCSGLIGTLVVISLERANIADTFVSIIVATGGIAHVLASGFLIGESFRQLFFLDPAAYQLPSWSNYWPHLS